MHKVEELHSSHPIWQGLHELVVSKKYPTEHFLQIVLSHSIQGYLQFLIHELDVVLTV